MKAVIQADDRLMSTGEVCAKFGVTPSTVSRYVLVGKLTRLRTVGGHGRYRESEVSALFRECERRGGT